MKPSWDGSWERLDKLPPDLVSALVGFFDLLPDAPSEDDWEGDTVFKLEDGENRLHGPSARVTAYHGAVQSYSMSVTGVCRVVIENDCLVLVLAESRSLELRLRPAWNVRLRC